MHTHHISDYPNIFANTDGGQTEGLFYLHAPLNYHEVAGSPPLPKDHPNYWDRPLPGHAIIVFSMERLKSLAEEEGSPDDLLTLEGPLDGDRSDPAIEAWFYQDGPANGLLAQVQVPRTNLRAFWTWQILPELTSQLENCKVLPDKEGSFIKLLEQLQSQLNQWRQEHEPKAT